MPKKIVSILVAFLLFLAGGGGGGGDAWANEVLIVQGGSSGPYEEAVLGFEQAMAAYEASQGVKSLVPVLLPKVTLNSGEDVAVLQTKIKERQCSILLAVGQKALEALAGIDHVPIVYLLVPSPGLVRIRPDNLTGIKLSLPPERQLATLVEARPDIRRVGVIFDPAHSADLVQAADKFLSSQARQLVPFQATEPRQMAVGLQALNGKIDALWMLPDRDYITSAAMETMALFSMQTHIPIISFSEKFLETGAMMAIVPDPKGVGSQASIPIIQILQGIPVSQISVLEPQASKIHINEYVAEHLGALPPNGNKARGVKP